MTRHPRLKDGDFDYKYLFVDVKGHPRIYLKNADEKKRNETGPKPRKTFFGIPLY
jgi:mitochondrial import inner membrane translocase subunit TIM21